MRDEHARLAPSVVYEVEQTLVVFGRELVAVTGPSPERA
jgi:hypothetical protein